MYATIVEAQQAIQRARRIIDNALADADYISQNPDVGRSLTGLHNALYGCEFYVADILEYVHMLASPLPKLRDLPAPPPEGAPNA